MKTLLYLQPNRILLSRLFVKMCQLRHVYLAAVVVLLSAALLQGCKSENPEPPAVSGECSQRGTVRGICGGFGAWQHYWIELENGKHLIPWSGSANFTPHEGQQILFSYTPVTADNSYAAPDSLICCLVARPFPAVTARIDCVKLENKVADCSVYATVQYQAETDTTQANVIFQMDNGLLYWPIFSSTPPPLFDGQRVKIGYEVTDIQIAIYPPPINITCISPAEKPKPNR